VEVYDRSEDFPGEVIERRLTNISRAEPLAELFDVPQTVTSPPRSPTRDGRDG
jgi:hypothetical protein